jgi:hypothetical protein
VHEDHVASGAVKQRCQDLSGFCRAVFPKDTLVGDASGDLHPGIAGDLAEDLVEAGVVC